MADAIDELSRGNIYPLIADLVVKRVIFRVP
jgi:hypothetical protein